MENKYNEIMNMPMTTSDTLDIMYEKIDLIRDRELISVKENNSIYMKMNGEMVLIYEPKPKELGLTKEQKVNKVKQLINECHNLDELIELFNYLDRLIKED